MTFSKVVAFDLLGTGSYHISNPLRWASTLFPTRDVPRLRGLDQVRGLGGQDGEEQLLCGWLMMVDDGWWWLMIVDGGWWWLMMVDGGWWWLMMGDGGWWYLMDMFGIFIFSKEDTVLWTGSMRIHWFNVWESSWSLKPSIYHAVALTKMVSVSSASVEFQGFPQGPLGTPSADAGRGLQIRWIWCKIGRPGPLVILGFSKRLKSFPIWIVLGMLGWRAAKVNGRLIFLPRWELGRRFRGLTRSWNTQRVPWKPWSGTDELQILLYWVILGTNKKNHPPTCCHITPEPHRDCCWWPMYAGIRRCLF